MVNLKCKVSYIVDTADHRYYRHLWSIYPWHQQHWSSICRCKNGKMEKLSGGEAHSPAGEGLGESQFRRLEKKLSTLLLRVLLYTLASFASVFAQTLTHKIMMCPCIIVFSRWKVSGSHLYCCCVWSIINRWALRFCYICAFRGSVKKQSLEREKVFTHEVKRKVPGPTRRPPYCTTTGSLIRCNL